MQPAYICAAIETVQVVSDISCNQHQFEVLLRLSSPISFKDRRETSCLDNSPISQDEHIDRSDVINRVDDAALDPVCESRHWFSLVLGLVAVDVVVEGLVESYL